MGKKLKGVFIAICILVLFSFAYAQLGEYVMTIVIRTAAKFKDTAAAYFYDSDMYIYSSTDGQLDIVSDTEAEVTATIVDFQTDTITAGLGFWSGAPSPANNSMKAGFFYTNDFVGEVLLPVATGVANGWKGAGDATYDVLSAAGTLGGWCLLAPEAGSNNEVYFQMGQIGTETFVECTVDNGIEWWLEYNLTPSSVTNAANWFVGLAEEGAAAADFINDSGADIADKDVILFGIFEGDPNGLQAIWQTAGAAFDTCASGTVNITAINYTLGFHFDGATTVTYYVNGTALCTQDISATGFPDGEELSPIIAMKQGASAININLDWIKLVAERQ